MFTTIVIVLGVIGLVISAISALFGPDESRASFTYLTASFVFSLLMYTTDGLAVIAFLFLCWGGSLFMWFINFKDME